MPIATGGGSKPPKPKKPKPPKPPTLPATDTSVGGNTNAGKPPKKPPAQNTGTETSIAPKQQQQAGNNQTSKAIARQEAREAAAITRSKRQQMRAGTGRSKYGEEAPTYKNANTPSETRRYQSQKRIGRAINAPGVKDPYRASSPGTRSGAGSRSTVTLKSGATYAKGGSSFGDAKAPRTVSYEGSTKRGGTEYGGERERGGIGGINPINISEGRIGGGFKEFGSGYRPPPAYFDTGAAGGGGAGGGAANPLAGGANFSGESLEEVLHGAKKKGRVKRARRTE